MSVKTIDELDALIDTRAAADLLHMNLRTVQRLCKEGRIPAAKVGREWLVTKEAMASLLSPTNMA